MKVEAGQIVLTNTRTFGEVVKVCGDTHVSIVLFARMPWGYVRTAQRRFVAMSEIVAVHAPVTMAEAA